jgi:uncharacterized DUF497 family protein
MYNKKMRIEWDELKNKGNIKKHGVAFEEAKSVFFDPLAKVAPDPDHSSEENRFLAIGCSFLQRHLLVVHCFREGTDLIRIISARLLTRSERKQYEEIF